MQTLLILLSAFDIQTSGLQLFQLLRMHRAKLFGVLGGLHLGAVPWAVLAKYQLRRKILAGRLCTQVVPQDQIELQLIQLSANHA